MHLSRDTSEVWIISGPLDDLGFLASSASNLTFFFLCKFSVRLEGGNYIMKQTTVNVVFYFFNSQNSKTFQRLEFKVHASGSVKK